jgi:CheY-like chemotaxis protein
LDYFETPHLDTRLSRNRGSLSTQSQISVSYTGRESSHNLTKTPIIALTAYALKEEAEKSIAAGFAAHVTKPIRKHDLFKVVLEKAA